jgi:signal transduction histidine kinase
MAGLRLQTKFLLSMLLVSAGLTFTTLLVVRQTVRRQIRQEIEHDLRNSVVTFQDFQRQREETLTHAAQLIADLPDVRALMTTRDVPTIQDASRGVWQLSGSDLFLLADPSGRVMALHGVPAEFTNHIAQNALGETLKAEQPNHWWYGGGHLYQVFLQPIYFGRPDDHGLLGYVVLGYEIDDRITRVVSRVAASQVAFQCSDLMVRSTLSPSQEIELVRQAVLRGGPSSNPEQIQLGDERFLATSVELDPGAKPSVRLSVLKSFDEATAFLNKLNQFLVGLGLTAVLAGSLLVFLISHTFTRPLSNLVAGVRALGQGDYDYPLDTHGGDEMAEVAVAFDRMRDNVKATQRELLEAERLATIGRMASSISHDLRHSLAAIVANAEFLCEGNLTVAQREELYGEVRVAVNQMTELIESLLEFSRTRESLRPTYGSAKDMVERAIQTVRSHPEYHSVPIDVVCHGACEAWFDSKKLERVLQNLLLNACEAIPAHTGRVRVELRKGDEQLEILVEDNGPGIADAVKDKLFEPFISFGKENGTGMGLTVVQKIVEDHGGTVEVARSSAEGTVFKVTLPVHLASDRTMAIRAHA